VVLNHGETAQLASLASTIKTRWDKLGFETSPEVIVPENLEAVRLYPRSSKLHAALLYS
jgi:hypothetical protein